MSFHKSLPADLLSLSVSVVTSCRYGLWVLDLLCSSSFCGCWWLVSSNGAVTRRMPSWAMNTKVSFLHHLFPWKAIWPYGAQDQNWVLLMLFIFFFIWECGLAIVFQNSDLKCPQSIPIGLIIPCASCVCVIHSGVTNSLLLYPRLCTISSSICNSPWPSFSPDPWQHVGAHAGAPA